MSLPVPLTVSVGGRMVTAEVADLAWRKEAIGGTKSITFKLSHPLVDLEAAAMARAEVVVYDGRTALPVARGRITDPTKTASADGQTREVTAFGLSLAVADVTRSYVVVDSSVSHWERCSALSTNRASTDTESDSAGGSLSVSFEEDKDLTAEWKGTWWTRLFLNAGTRVGLVYAVIEHDFLFASPIRVRVGACDPTASVVGRSLATSDVGFGVTAIVPTHLSTAYNYLPVLALFNNAGAAWTPDGDHRARFRDVTVRAVLKTATGSDRLAASDYSSRLVYPHEVVNDLLGRGMLPAFSGADALVDATATYGIDQLAYPDGVNAEQVLTDLMRFAESHRWHVDDAGRFRWEPWPTTVRYEVTLDGGGSFPVTTADLYNEVEVRWSDSAGRSRTTTRTGDCPILTESGERRRAILDLGSEVGSALGAVKAGDNFLADHRIPRNTGSITIDRPIRDVVTGAAVQPHEIRHGELIRVLGIESYPDALNAARFDGATVFRIHATNYTASANAAVLELDADTRSTAAALARLLTKRTRR